MSLPMQEQWRPIPGYEGLYEVSDLGRVRGVDRQKPYRNSTKFTRGRVITQNPNQDGYQVVRLYRDGAVRYYKVHGLMAEAFFGPRPGGFVVCHADDDRSNNVLANLRYGSRSDNQHDAVRNHRHARASQSHCKRGHLLLDPNLDQSFRSRRACLACRRAAQRVRRARNRGVHLNCQTVADDYYRRIMKE